MLFEQARVMKRLAAATAIAVLVLLANARCANAAASISLSSLEQKIDGALSLAAAQAHLRAADELERAATAQSGTSYVFNDVIGPRSDLNSQITRVPYYSQHLGLSFPLLGTRTSQSNAIIEAARNRDDAQAELVQAKRDLLERLRNAYVTYWQLDQAATLDRDYVTRSHYDAKIAHALVNSGFWTHAQLLDFLDFYAKIRTDGFAEQSGARSQLAAIEAALGSTVGAFRPEEPHLDRCTTALDVLGADAAKNDATIAQTEALIKQYRSELKNVPGSAVNGSASVTLGTSLNSSAAGQPANAAFSVNGGVALSMPTRGREAEDAQARALTAEIDEQQLLEKQRVADLRASLQAAIDDLQAARDALAQAQGDDHTLHEELREAEVRLLTQRMETQPLFTDVQTALTQTYVADRAVIDAQATVQLKAVTLMTLSPNACGSKL